MFETTKASHWLVDNSIGLAFTGFRARFDFKEPRSHVAERVIKINNILCEIFNRALFVKRSIIIV